MDFIVLSFKHWNSREGYKQHYLPNLEIKGYNIMIDGRHFHSQTIKKDLKTYANFRKVATDQGDDYAPGC